jgi:prevent-host-death family protein
MLDIQPVNQYIHSMKTVGIFEAKTRLSEICEEVAQSGIGVVVTRRGKPLVRIDPIADERFSVWEDRSAYVTEHGKMKEEFDIPARDRRLPSSLLDD